MPPNSPATNNAWYCRRLRLQSRSKRDSLVFSHGPHTQAPRCPVQQKPDANGDGNYKIDQQILFKERVSHLRQACQARDPKVLQAADGLSDIGLADDRRKTKSKEHERQARCELVSSPRDHKIGEDHVERGAGKRCRKHSNVGIAALGGDDEAADGADEHHAFKSQVHDSRAFADHFAHGCIKDRGAG